MNKHTIKIPIGDWSDDGHGKCNIFEIESNYPVEDLQNAYKASCKLVGIQFNHNENYMDIPINSYRNNERLICTEYEDSQLSVLARELLAEHGVNVEEILDYTLDDDDEEIYLDTDAFTKLLLAFIGLSMPKDWEWKFTEREGQYLNGFWNQNLNVQFGYGLFN